MRRAMPLAVAALVLLAGCTTSVSDDDDAATGPGAQVEETADGTDAAGDKQAAADAAKDAAAGDAAAGGDAAAEQEAAEIIGDALDPDSERAFGATDDMVVETILRATDAASAEWNGSTVEISFAEGSAADPTAGLNCLAFNALIGPDEKALIVYGDGEYDCDQRR